MWPVDAGSGRTECTAPVAAVVTGTAPHATTVSPANDNETTMLWIGRSFTFFLPE
jgi:hypothetical protein